MNKWVGLGRLTATPELKTTGSGIPVCSFTVAIDRKYKTDGEKQTDFINCVAWRHTAEFICKYFTKGKMIALEGSIQVRSWEDDEGNTRYVTEALIDSVHFCGDGERVVDRGDSSSKADVEPPKSKSKPKKSTKTQEPKSEDVSDDEDDLPF